MSRRLMALSWLSAVVVAGLLGHLMAQKLHAIPQNGYCPILSNTDCPTCWIYYDPLVGAYVNCHITTGSYSTCISDPSYPSCGNTRTSECYRYTELKVRLQRSRFSGESLQ